MVEFDKVSKVYPDGTRAVDRLDLSVAKGEFVVLIGPSGCGKTTSLKMVNRLEDVTEGMIRVNGEDIMSQDPVKLRRNIGYVIQEAGLRQNLTVAENVATVPHLIHWPKKKVDERLEYLFRMAGLDPEVYKHRLPSQLSGGQQQRIGVLRGLAADPEVVLMDEPFGALDPITKGKLQGELIELQEKVHKTIIFVTHDIDEALKLADRVLLMRRGKIEQLGTPDELQNDPKNAFVRDFIGEDRLSQITPEGSVETMLEDAPLTVQPDRSPQDVLDLMAEHSRETAQVVRRNGSWAGMVFLGDVRRGMRGGMAQVSDVARKDRALYLPEATIRDAAELLVDMEAPVPVVGESGKLVGLVTNASLARLAINRLTRGGRSN